MDLLKNARFISAVIFTLGALSVTFDGTGIEWMWTQTPVVGVALGAVGLSFWFAFARHGARARDH